MHTHESRRRRAATIALNTCVAEAAAAVARAPADGDADLVAAANAYSSAATDLRDAHPEKKGDAHISFRVAEASYRASVASSKAVGDDAVAAAQKLVEASNAFGVAAKAVVDALDVDTKLVRRQDLAAAEDALKNLFSATTAAPTTAQSKPRKPEARKTAHRPRPNTRTDRSRPTNASSRRRRAGGGSGVASARAASPASAARASTAAT